MAFTIDDDDETHVWRRVAVYLNSGLKLKRVNGISRRHQGGPRGPITWVLGPRPRPAQRMDKYAGTLLSLDLGL